MLVLVALIGTSRVRLGFESSPDDLVFLIDDAQASADVVGPEVTLTVSAEPPFKVMTGRSLGDGRVAVVHALLVVGEVVEAALEPALDSAGP